MKAINPTDMNLRDLQDLIEWGEYDTHPVSQWRDRRGERMFYYCSRDGTVYAPHVDHCPSPYHPEPKPRPQPPQASGRGFLYAILGGALLVLIYSIINNEVLMTLIVTFLLLLISVVVFVILFVFFSFLSSVLDTPLSERENDRRFLGPFFSVAASFFSTIFVSILQREFPPDLSWWIIGFAVERFLEGFVFPRLDRWVVARIEHGVAT